MMRENRGNYLNSTAALESNYGRGQVHIVTAIFAHHLLSFGHKLVASLLEKANGNINEWPIFSSLDGQSLYICSNNST